MLPSLMVASEPKAGHHTRTKVGKLHLAYSSVSFCTLPPDGGARPVWRPASPRNGSVPGRPRCRGRVGGAVRSRTARPWPQPIEEITDRDTEIPEKNLWCYASKATP